MNEGQIPIIDSLRNDLNVKISYGLSASLERGHQTDYQVNETRRNN